MSENEGLLDKDGGEWEMCRRVLDRGLELGVKRLSVDEDGGGSERSETSVAPVEEDELMSLRKLVLNHADIFDALCGNIHRQIRHWECEDPGLAVSVRGGEGSEVEEDVRVLSGIQRTVQVVHLDAMRESIKAGEAEGAVSHIRFLHFDHGLEQSEYRYASLLFLSA